MKDPQDTGNEERSGLLLGVRDLGGLESKSKTDSDRIDKGDRKDSDATDRKDGDSGGDSDLVDTDGTDGDGKDGDGTDGDAGQDSDGTDSGRDRR